MASPAPTTADPATPPVTTGTVHAVGDGMFSLSLPGTDYRIDLVIEGSPPAVGEKVSGTIHARAQRVDVISGGGRYVEPVFGRPRRVQGTIVGGDLNENAIFVAAGGANLVCVLTDPRQQAGQFNLSEMVTFDVERGARFTPKA